MGLAAFSADSASREVRDRGRRRAGTPPSGRSLPPGSSPSRPPPSSQLLLGHQLRPRLPLPEPPPRSGAHPRAPLPPPSPATRPEHQPRGGKPAQPASHQPSPARPPQSMNLFRFLGDLSHLLAIILLLLKIWKSRSCAGETPMGREKGGECGGHPTTRGRVWRHEGDGSPRPSPPLLTGDPPSRSGVTGGVSSLPQTRGIYSLVGGGSRHPVQLPLALRGWPRDFGAGSREPWQAGRWLGVGDVDRGGRDGSGRAATGSRGPRSSGVLRSPHLASGLWEDPEGPGSGREA